jgi:hypothetical protein
VKEEWWLQGRIIMAGEGKNAHVIVGETCGAPKASVGEWIVARHNYEIKPWFKRLWAKTPRFKDYGTER